jgi:hypothetical protein
VRRITIITTPVIDPDSIFKKLASDRARIETLGVTEHEMMEFYNRCGSEGQDFDEAIAELNARFRLSAADAAFVVKVLGDCAPFD